MRTLSERDVADLLSVTAEIVALEEADPFPPRLVARIADLIANHEATYCELDRGHEHFMCGSWWCDGEGAIETADDQPDGDAYWRLRHTHPVCSYRERMNDWTNVHKVSDFATQREFRRTEIWNAEYRDAGINYWIDVGLRPTGKQTRMFIFSREARDYDERDRLVLELLQPHLQARYDRVQAAAEAADALASIEETGDDPGHVVLCSADGVIEFASPDSRRLLATYFEGVNGRIPAGLLSAVRYGRAAFAIEGDGRRLTLRATPCAGLLVLLLGEVDTRLDRLTPRQRTILAHVASGETDGEIAADVGIAPSTVNKHLENIYERLGVHTRTAAAAVFTPRADAPAA